MIATVERLAELIRESQILSTAQLKLLTETLQTRFPEPNLLAKELMRRGWLTDFQLRRVIHGRAQELFLGPYILLDRVGYGSMGEVFKARRRRDGCLVALKAIRSDRRADKQALCRFRREVQAMAQVSHPNIVSACDTTEIGVAHYYAMEYVDGVNLDRLVSQRGALPIATACDYMRQASLGLQHAHERGLIHRDIKPANLLVIPPPSKGTKVNGLSSEAQARFGRWGTIKVLDLGLVLLKETDGPDPLAGLTQAGLSIGTVDYMAPEQVEDPHKVDIRADLYSLGCTFYEILTGKLPFPKGTAVEKLMAHRTREPLPVKQLRPEVPGVVASIVHKLMAKKPDERPAKPGDVSALLAGILVRMDPKEIDWDWKPPAKLEAKSPTDDASVADANPWWSNQYVLTGIVAFFITVIIYLSVFR